ncbi:ceramide kinase-like isoform X2 [Varroa destructor]|uniref:DAGKc domain-containing protein n=1 Tax=Varroa destructor TaxID=109461 RepID=A0A7M7JFI9_VARDE|nr:ceramide kinase-like isoform X2 [Varroa destructor]
MMSSRYRELRPRFQLDVHVPLERLLSATACKCPTSLSSGGPRGALGFVTQGHPYKCCCCCRIHKATATVTTDTNSSQDRSTLLSRIVPDTASVTVNHQCRENFPSKVGPAARIYFAIQNSSSLLRLRSLQLVFETVGARDRFVTSVWRAIETLVDRPRKLLVFINPFGGRKRARTIYNEKAAPVFQICGIHCVIVITTHSGHSREYVTDKDLSVYDGVVCVGGDGMANELINGLMQKTLRSADAAATAATHQLLQDEKHLDASAAGNGETSAGGSGGVNVQASGFELPGRPSLPVGVIPAGSTDALVCTTTGAHCALNSALHIAIGSRIRIDLGSIHSQGRLIRFFAGFLSYGFFGDNVQSAEKYRWMGPLRYSWTGWQTLLKNRAYGGKVDVQLLENDVSGNKLPFCLKGCERCRLTPLCPPAERPQLSDTFRGKLQSLSCSLLANRCSKSRAGFAPRAHLGDGLMNICVVKECSRVDFVRFLTAIGNSQRQDPFDFSFVRSYRALSFEFTPDNTKKDKSLWHCDGEVLPNCTQIAVKCHNQALTLFASGVSNGELEQSIASGPSSLYSSSPASSKLCLASNSHNAECSLDPGCCFGSISNPQCPNPKPLLLPPAKLTSDASPLCAATVLCGV